MKNLTKRYATATLVAVLALSSLTVGAATGNQNTVAEKDSTSVSDSRNYTRHHGMMNLNSVLTDEEYKAEVEKYRKERRVLLEEELNKEVADGTTTREEADLYLKDFDAMGEYAGSHMMGNSSGYRMGHGMMNRSTTVRGNGGHCW